MGPLRVEWLGRVEYRDAHARMERLVEDRVRGGAGDTLLLCEHEPVYTLGRSRSAADNAIDPGDVPVIGVERGGDVTFHGPGQLVGYPVVRLPDHRRDLHAWLRGLEDVGIGVLARWGVRGGRDARNTGVWVDGRKLVAIGVAARRWVTWHGFAINVTTDLAFFARVRPCGLDGALVTRISDHVSPCPTLATVRDATAAEFRRWWREWSAPRAPG